MAEKKVNYREYILLGMNKAMLAFLISFLLCLSISLVINLYFYEELVTLTIGGLGETERAEFGTILKTAVLILGLSTFQMSGKFQMGLLILAVIPLFSFLISGLIFRMKASIKDNLVDLGIHVLTDGLAALIYSGFIFLSSVVARGQLFGLNINFVSIRNFGFAILFVIFIQFFLGLNRQNTFTVLTLGLLRIRKLLHLILSFSALTGILFILYYVAPYLKGITKIAIFIVLILPNLAVYLSFLLMGISPELGESFKSLTSYLPGFNWSAFAIPTSIRVVLIIAFLLMVLILLVRIPAKQYWQNLLFFVFGFSCSTWLLAVASRINLGFRGVLNINFEIPLWRAFLVPFTLILLDGILLALLRMLCCEIKGDNVKGSFAVFFCGLEEESNGGMPVNQVQDEDDDETEIDIWKELAARQLPSFGGNEVSFVHEEKQERKSFFTKAQIRMEETPINQSAQESSERINESVHSRDYQIIAEKLGNKIELNEKKSEAKMSDSVKAGKEIDISLFPRKKKSPLRGFMDFSDIEDNIFVGEHEAEEVLETFTKNDDLYLEKEIKTEQTESESMEQTRVIGKMEVAPETWENTIPYKINHRQSIKE